MNRSAGSPSPMIAWSQTTRTAGFSVLAVLLLASLSTASAQVAPPSSPPNAPSDRNALAVEVEVTDPGGEPLAGVDVVVSIEYIGSSGSRRLVFDSAVSDPAGKARRQVARGGPGELRSSASVLAHRPGRAIARLTVPAVVGRTPQGPPRLVLGEPARRTIAVIGPDDRPVAGLRLVPRSVRLANERTILSIPEPWLDRFSATTDADGVAVIPDLPANSEPLTVEVSGPQIAAHTLALTHVQVKLTLRLGRKGRLVGVVGATPR
jgi:hypothetical protein